MKKQYTKKQITEAVAYWKKQLENGNYRRADESYDDEVEPYDDGVQQFEGYTEIPYKDIRGGNFIDADYLTKIKNDERIQLRRYSSYDKAMENNTSMYYIDPLSKKFGTRKNPDDILYIPQNFEVLTYLWSRNKPRDGYMHIVNGKKFKALPGEFEDGGINWTHYRGYKTRADAEKRADEFTGTKNNSHLVNQTREGDYEISMHR